MTASSKVVEPVNMDALVNDVLNQISNNEQKANNTLSSHVQSHKTTVDDWIPINASFRRGDVAYIKHLIINGEIDINEDRDPAYGATLLIKAAIYGTYEIAQVLLQFNADIHLKDNAGQDAIFCATRFGNFHILELLILHLMGASLGYEVKLLITHMQKQNAISNFCIQQMSQSTLESIVNIIILAMEKRAPFSDDMLNIAWNFILNKCSNSLFHKAIESNLWLAMMQTFEDIISDTNNKKIGVGCAIIL